VLRVRHAFWCSVLTWSAGRRREIFIFGVLTTAGARSSESFLLCLYTGTIVASKRGSTPPILCGVIDMEWSRETWLGAGFSFGETFSLELPS